MEKNSFTLNTKKFPKAFLLSVLIVLAAETLFLCFEDYFFYPLPHLWGLRIKVKEQYSYVPGNHYDVLAYGDSYNTYAILPRMIYNQTGLSCYNFSTYFTQGPFVNYCMLKNYIKKCYKKPKIVVMGYTMPPFGYYLSKNDTAKYLAINAYIIPENVSVAVKEFGWVRMLAACVPSSKHHNSLKRLLKNPNTFRFPDKRLIDRIKGEIPFHNGYQPYEIGTIYTGSETGDRNDSFVYKADPFFVKYLRLSIKLAHDNGIKVIYLVASELPGRYQNSLERGIVKEMNDILFGLKEEFPDLVLINPQKDLNQREWYSDIYHLNRKGTLILSRLLSDQINALNGSTRPIPD